MEKWNYEKPDTIFGTQKDWNQTIVTALNSVVNENNLTHKRLLETLVPLKFKSIIDCLWLYNEFEEIIAGKYCIKFTPDDINVIIIEGCELEIENFKEQ